MRYQIAHTTHYTYSEAVCLGHHTLRLRPRSDGYQTLGQFSLDIAPNPELVSDQLDLFGSACVEVWFSRQVTSHLTIRTLSEVETHCTNPFNYLASPWAMTLPIDYPHSVAAGLTPYMHQTIGAGASAQVIDLAQQLLYEADGQLSTFLTLLTQRIYTCCTYVVREQGPPLPSGITWQQKQGTCRDFAVLFMDVCRAVGVAARFVSGYQEGDPDQSNHDLHAWVEAYIPGGGWRGFDPTHGLAVADRHIALAVGAQAHQAAPVTGSVRGGTVAQSTLVTQITIQQLTALS